MRGFVTNMRIKRFKFSVDKLRDLYGNKIQIERNFEIYDSSSMTSPRNNTLIFIQQLDDDFRKKIEELKDCVILINQKEQPIKLDNNLIFFVDRPRKEYSIILSYILSIQNGENRYKITEEGYWIGENVSIGTNTIIEPGVLLDDWVTIGNNSVIKSGAKIRKYTSIGNKCVIKENCVIGSEGFGVERDDDGKNYKIPHIGGIIIGDNVEIGALASINSGTIEPTFIDDYVKIDDNVFIAHNCKIEKGTLVIANAEVSGSVKIGKNCWIGPNVSIKDHIKIGNNVTVGIGAVVVKDIKDNFVVAGNPAEDINKLRLIRKKIRELLILG